MGEDIILAVDDVLQVLYELRVKCVANVFFQPSVEAQDDYPILLEYVVHVLCLSDLVRRWARS
jgi:hypothetical protein